MGLSPKPYKLRRIWAPARNASFRRELQAVRVAYARLEGRWILLEHLYGLGLKPIGFDPPNHIHFRVESIRPPDILAQQETHTFRMLQVRHGPGRLPPNGTHTTHTFILLSFSVNIKTRTRSVSLSCSTVSICRFTLNSMPAAPVSSVAQHAHTHTTRTRTHAHTVAPPITPSPTVWFGVLTQPLR